MKFRFSLIPLALLAAVTVCAQVTAPPADQTTPAPQAAPTAPAASVPSTPAPPPAGPDYPDPRAFTIGAFYWFTGAGTQPSFVTGHTATDFEGLPDLGKYHKSPGIEASMPITRTGSLHLEVFQTKGDTNTSTPVATDLFGTAQLNAGDKLTTAYQILDIKFYLDDLLYPHFFPVKKLRFKSIWAVNYMQIYARVSAPFDSTAGIAADSRKIILPEFGLAMEYALAPHVLFRVDGSGFGIYHRADIWDAKAELSWRRGPVEIVGGYKAFHFKTSPYGTDFLVGTELGGYAGARWHF